MHAILLKAPLVDQQDVSLFTLYLVLQQSSLHQDHGLESELPVDDTKILLISPGKERN